MSVIEDVDHHRDVDSDSRHTKDRCPLRSTLPIETIDLHGMNAAPDPGEFLGARTYYPANKWGANGPTLGTGDGGRSRV